MKGSMTQLRLMVILVSTLVALLMSAVHQNASSYGGGQEGQLKYNLVRVEEEIEEEKLFDFGGGKASAGDNNLHNSADVGAKPASSKRHSIWRRHEDVSKTYHVMLTAQSSKYLNWQSLLMYYHYRKQKDEAARRDGGKGGNDMGGFTRLVAANVNADDVSSAIPSKFVREIDRDIVMNEYKGYMVMNRPYSVKSFFDMNLHESLEEEFIFIAETDHLFMQPIPNLATVATPVAYPFAYMKNMQKELLPMVRSVCPSIRSIKQVQPIGPSPSIIHKDMLKRIVPEWYRISVELKLHQDNYGDLLGWILEMYAFAISAACLQIKFKILEDFQIEPTAATPCTAEDLKKNFIFHYTYPLEFDESGEAMPPHQVGYWSLNKRNYASTYPPRELEPPPEGAHAGAFYLREAWLEAIKHQTDNIWIQAPVTIGTVGWKPRMLTPIEMEKKGLTELIDSSWTWVYEQDKANLYGKPVLQFKADGKVKNPWGKGTWGELSVVPQLVSVDWSCPRYNPVLSVHVGNAMHVVCMNLQKKVMKSTRVPDGVINLGALIK